MTKLLQKSRWLGIALICLLTTLIVGAYFNRQVLAETLNVVTYDDNAIPPLSYTGSWTYSSNSANAMWSTLHWSNVAGNKVTYSFNGTRITRFYSMAANRGSEAIYIDGVFKGVYSSYASETRRQIGKTWDNLSAGNHTIEVRVNGGGYSDIDAFAVDIATVNTGAYDNTHSQVRYFGSWADSTYTVGSYNNSLKISNTSESGFRFTFSGDEITYLYSMHSNRGKATVTIDGSNKGYIDQYSSDLRRQIGQTFSGLGSGVHVLTVTNSGTKNSSSTDYYIDLDGLIVGNVYDSWLAIQYDTTWAHSRNPSYPNYGTDEGCNDCTNYLSQILKAGGIPEIENFSINNYFYWYSDYSWASKTWASADWLKFHLDVFPNRYLAYSGSPAQLSQGDFFLMDLRTDVAGPDHARFVVGNWPVEEGDDEGQIRLVASQHCVDRYRVKWDYKIPDKTTLYSYKVKY